MQAAVKNPYAFGRQLRSRVAQTRLVETMTARLKRSALAHAMRERMGADQTWGIFRDIEIETINRCNGRCSFCPVNAADDPRPLARMDAGTFSAIVGELSSMNYEGYIGLSSNNEPFLDKNIVSRIAECRSACPGARIYLYTNGTLLTFEKVTLALEAGLDSMTIDDYGDGLLLSENVQHILTELDEVSKSWMTPKVVVVLRRRTEVLRNRAGRSPNRSCTDSSAFTMYRKAGCLHPFNQLVIRPTGLASLCCNDCLGEVTMGDVTQDGLLGVWNGPEFQRVRRLLMQDGRASVGLCSYCDISCLRTSEALRLVLGGLGRVAHRTAM